MGEGGIRILREIMDGSIEVEQGILSGDEG